MGERLHQTLPAEVGGCSGCALRQCGRGSRVCDTAKVEHKIPVGVSARHAHISQVDLEVLYGSGHQLVIQVPLYQPGAFAAAETVTVVGPRLRALEGVRIPGDRALILENVRPKIDPSYVFQMHLDTDDS